jgi:signal transduction histidine kinase
VSHDLRAPLRAVDGFGLALDEDHGDKLDARGRDYLRRIREGAQHMSRLIDDLIDLSRINRAELARTRVDLSAVAAEVVAALREAEPGRSVEVVVQPGVTADGDPRLLRILLVNLLGNAWKYTGKKPGARIVFGEDARDGRREYFVRDDGVGFEMQYAGRLFSPFQRMHRREDFPGTGIGLATVHRIVARHRGTIRADAAPERGAEFRFTLGEGGTA